MCEIPSSQHTYCESSIKERVRGTERLFEDNKMAPGKCGLWLTALVQSPDNIVGVSQWERLNIDLKAMPL